MTYNIKVSVAKRFRFNYTKKTQQRPNKQPDTILSH